MSGAYEDVLQPDLVADYHNNYCDVACIIGFHYYRYDFDKDGTITAEDVDRVLSYIPLNTRPINTYSAAPTANKSLSGKLNKNSRGQSSSENFNEQNDPMTIS